MYLEPHFPGVMSSRLCYWGTAELFILSEREGKEGTNNIHPGPCPGLEVFILQTGPPDPFPVSTQPEEMKTRKTVCTQNNEMEFRFGFTLEYKCSYNIFSQLIKNASSMVT